MIAHNLDMSKVMILIYKTVIKRVQVSMPDYFNLYRFKISNVTGYRGDINFNVFNNFFYCEVYILDEDNQAGPK